MKFIRKPYRWAILFSFMMAAFVTYILLETFVIPRPQSSTVSSPNDGALDLPVSAASPGGSATAVPAAPVITGNSYKDENIQVTIDTVRNYDTDIYVADIRVSSAEYLKTALAKDTFGRNVKEATSAIASNHNAIFAVNGDFYGFRDYGFVLRNGVLYRDNPRQTGNDEDLVIDDQGNFSIINERLTDPQTLVDQKVWQVLSFGPALVSNGEITVTSDSEVDQSMASNPRTAIGQVSALHYIFIVSDGRTRQSAGLSLLELAQEFKDRGCSVAYNLDGGGSATMWFEGGVVNIPTDGSSFSERSVSDIVYLGY